MQKEINKAFDLIKSSKHIFFFTGAGISTSSGIPDFRSKNGLYNMVRDLNRDIENPELVFDISYFKKDPSLFYEVSSLILNYDVVPTLSHRFIAHIEQLGKLSLLVTQNIDMLHTKAGNKNVFECHGSYSEARCLTCDKTYSFCELEATILNRQVPLCNCGGVIKPNVVFFGEQLPFEFYDIYEDPPHCDLVVVVGTSLTVQPAASLPLKLLTEAKSIIINKEKTIFDGKFDLVIHEESDLVFDKIWKMIDL